MKEIKTSLFQIYQCIFKPITFADYTNNLDKKSKLKLLLKLSLYSYIISILIVLTAKFIIFYFLKVPFNWTDLLSIAFSIAFGIAVGIAAGIAGGIAFGIAAGIAGGIAQGITLGIAAGIAGGIAVGIAFGIAVGIAAGIAAGIDRGIDGGIDGGIALGIGVGIVFGIAGGIALGIDGGIAGGIAGSISFFVFYSRVFYVLPHLIQYFRAKLSNKNLSKLFKKSPIYWDEIIIYPLPFLTNFLVMLTEANRDQGIAETEFVSTKRPTQRKAAFNALLEITIKDLSKLESIKAISDASGNLSFLSSFESFLPKEFSKTLRVVEDLSIDAKNYINSSSDFNKLKNLNNVESDIIDLKKSLIATKGPVGVKFLSLAETWLQIVEEEKKQFTKSNVDNFEEIQNPYIFGNPVKVDDSSRLFVGRKDVVDLIKSNLTSNISQKPSLFLYGRRRVGKSSVLINLPKLLEKQYISVYIDFQDPKYGESQSSFCYHLSKVICDSLNDRGFPSEYPSLGSFQNNPFTTLSGWLDDMEGLLEKESKLVLICFDEYEKIEERIIKGSLTKDVLDQLRNIIQHRKYFVILISGSNELRELQLGWSDYLINTKMIEIGYLSKDDARILITNPIDDFTLNYEGGQHGETVTQIMNLTNCQPYLTQAVCFELVNCLNSQCRKEASFEDVNLAGEKVLSSANAYFDYIWNIECTDSERELLHQIMENSYKEGNKKEIDSLLRRDIIEKDGNSYRFKVELVKMWIEENAVYN